MAIRWAVASGNWSSTSTWNGGTLPTSADDVFANNFTVTIDQDITAITLRNTSNTSPAITAGGTFTVTGSSGTRNITLTGTLESGGSSISGIATLNNNTPALRIASTSGQTVNFTSPLGFPVTNIGCSVFIEGNAIVNYAGNLNTLISSGNYFQIRNTAANGTLNAVSTLTSNAGSINIGAINIAASNYTLNFVGNMTAVVDYCILTSQACTVNITGNITAGIAQAISAQAAGLVCNVTGNVAAATSQAINSLTVQSTITVNGNVSASSTSVGIFSNNASSIVTANGNLTNVNDFMAVFCPKMRISPTAQQTWTFQTSSGNRQLSTSNVFSGYPSVSDVRRGITYASGTLTGTCDVPNAASVLFGVPVDNTTGSAIYSRAQFLSDMGALVAGYTI